MTRLRRWLLRLAVAVVALTVTNLWVARERDEKTDALRDRERALQEKDGALTAARESETRAVQSATKADQERKRAESYFLKARVAIRDILTQMLEFHRYELFMSPEDDRTILAHHRAVFEAIAARQPDAADAAMRRHLEWVLAHYDAAGSPPQQHGR